MTFLGCVGRRQSDSCIPVTSVSIDLPVHTCTEVNQHFIKKKSFKFFKHLNIFLRKKETVYCKNVNNS